jgi:cytoskeleton protein RodZ
VEVEGADGTTQVHSLAEPEDQAVIAAQGNEQSSPLLLPVESGEAPEAASTAEQPAAEAGTAESAQEAPAAPVSDAPAAPAPASAVEPATPVAVSAGQGVLNVQFTADCWTQVTDADGKVLLSALKRSGERIELTGKSPIKLHLGFARGAQVTYNGENVDVTPHISGETARLTLGL